MLINSFNTINRPILHNCRFSALHHRFLLSPKYVGKARGVYKQ